jgi:hypothetical protein
MKGASDELWMDMNALKLHSPENVNERSKFFSLRQDGISLEESYWRWR